MLLLLWILLYPIDQPEPCYGTLSAIVQHEAGNVPEAVPFLAAQVRYDIRRLGCAHLTQWRWKIGRWPVVSSRTERLLKQRVAYPQCQLVGSPHDISAWHRAGYATRIDYVFTHGPLTVIGVNCDHPSLRRGTSHHDLDE
jgi:hypothetical protein